MTLNVASILLLAGILGLPPASAQDATAAEATTPAGCRADYVIRAQLDGETKRLAGEETIRWTNRTTVATSELWFHLYLNAFANNQSLFSRQRGAAHEDGEWGWQRIGRIAVGGVDVTPSLIYSTEAADVAPADRTAFQVTLPEGVAPGQSVDIEVEWSSRLPRLRRRTGYSGDFLMVAQWFPKLGVFEGEKGWNCHPFHGSTEFFADYGTYQVTLDLPVEYENKVGGTGLRVNSLKKGDRVEVVFEAPSPADRQRLDTFGKLPLVHDFVWAADPDFVVREYHFDYDEWVAKGPAYQSEVELIKKVAGEGASVALRDVDVTLLIHREHRNQADRFFDAVGNTLFFYGLWFGDYPYEHLTVVDPGWGNWGAGGMEYPTLFTSGTRLFTSAEQQRPEGLIVHECGHQFWYGLVGNNEVEAAWLDEGLNAYTDSEVLALAYGQRTSTTDYSRIPLNGVLPASLPDGGAFGAAIDGRQWKWDIETFHDFPVLRSLAHHTLQPLRSSGLVDAWRDQPFTTLVDQWDDPRWEDRALYLSNPQGGVIDFASYRSSDHRTYRANSYQRPAVALRTLAGVVGREAFLAGMRNFAKKYRYGHPYGPEFYDAFNEGAEQDLSWYFADAFQSTKTIDWKIAAVSQARPEEPKGWFPGEDGAYKKYEKPAAEDGESAEETEDRGAEAEEAPAKLWEIEILLKREGELCLDLPVRIVFENGAQQDFVWLREHQLKQPWLKVEFEDERNVKAVVLDPDRRYYLDLDMSDNQWFAEGDEVAPLRWTEKVMNQYGHLLHWYAGIGG